MKSLSLLLSLLLCMQLYATTQEECSQRTGYRWDDNLGCVTSQAVQDTREGAEECNDLSGQALTRCLENSARDASSEIKNEYSGSAAKNDSLKIGIPLLLSMLTGYISIKHAKDFKKSGCAKASMFILTGSAVAATTGEIIARSYHETKLRKAKKEYEAAVSSGDENMSQGESEDNLTNNQVRAFGYLKRIEKVREESEKIRKIAHMVSTAGYAAVSVMAIYEMIAGNGQGLCQIKSQNSCSNKSTNYNSIPTNLPTLESYSYLDSVNLEEYKEVLLRSLYFAIDNVIPTASAQKFDKGVLDLGGASKKEVCKLVGEIESEGKYATSVSSDGSVSKGKKLIKVVGQLLGGGELDGCLDTNVKTMDEIVIRGNQKVTVSDQLKTKDVETNLGNTDIKAEKLDTQLQSQKVKCKEPESKGKIVKMLEKTLTRAALGITLGTGSVILYKNAQDNIDESKRRQGEIQKIIDAFTGSGGASFTRCSEEDRQNSEKPLCYCYNADGSQNTRRRNLVICKSAWGSAANVTASDYNNSGNDAADMTRTCITKSYEADITCACKSNDSCLKTVPKFNMNGGAYTMANQIGGTINSTNSGGLTSGELEEGSLVNQARSYKKQIDKLKKNNKAANLIAKANKLSNGLQSSLSKNLGPYSSKIARSLGANSFSPSSLNKIKSDPKKAVENLNKEIEKSLSSRRKSGEKATSFDLDFGEESKAGIEIQDDLAQVMDKDFKIKGDINNNPDHNIFKILSNRYKSTGLKRLFDEK